MFTPLRVAINSWISVIGTANLLKLGKYWIMFCIKYEKLIHIFLWVLDDKMLVHIRRIHGDFAVNDCKHYNHTLLHPCEMKFYWILPRIMVVAQLITERIKKYQVSIIKTYYYKLWTTIYQSGSVKK